MYTVQPNVIQTPQRVTSLKLFILLVRGDHCEEIELHEPELHRHSHCVHAKSHFKRRTPVDIVPTLKYRCERPALVYGYTPDLGPKL